MWEGWEECGGKTYLEDLILLSLLGLELREQLVLGVQHVELVLQVAQVAGGDRVL